MKGSSRSAKFKRKRIRTAGKRVIKRLFEPDISQNTWEIDIIDDYQPNTEVLEKLNRMVVITKDSFKEIHTNEKNGQVKTMKSGLSHLNYDTDSIESCSLQNKMHVDIINLTSPVHNINVTLTQSDPQKGPNRQINNVTETYLNHKKKQVNVTNNSNTSIDTQNALRRKYKFDKANRVEKSSNEAEMCFEDKCNDPVDANIEGMIKPTKGVLNTKLFKMKVDSIDLTLPFENASNKFRVRMENKEAEKETRNNEAYLNVQQSKLNSTHDTISAITAQKRSRVKKRNTAEIYLKDDSENKRGSLYAGSIGKTRTNKTSSVNLQHKKMQVDTIDLSLPTLKALKWKKRNKSTKLRNRYIYAHLNQADRKANLVSDSVATPIAQKTLKGRLRIQKGNMLESFPKGDEIYLKNKFSPSSDLNIETRLDNKKSLSNSSNNKMKVDFIDLSVPIDNRLKPFQAIKRKREATNKIGDSKRYSHQEEQILNASIIGNQEMLNRRCRINHKNIIKSFPKEDTMLSKSNQCLSAGNFGITQRNTRICSNRNKPHIDIINLTFPADNTINLINGKKQKNNTNTYSNRNKSDVDIIDLSLLADKSPNLLNGRKSKSNTRTYSNRNKPDVDIIDLTLPVDNALNLLKGRKSESKIAEFTNHFIPDINSQKTLKVKCRINMHNIVGASSRQNQMQMKISNTSSNKNAKKTLKPRQWKTCQRRRNKQYLNRKRMWVDIDDPTSVLGNTKKVLKRRMPKIKHRRENEKTIELNSDQD